MAAVETVQSKFDTVKLAVALLLLLAGAVAFHYYSEQFILLYRVLSLLGVVMVAVFIIYQTALGKTVWQYFQDSRVELRKVVWPMRSETMQTTLVVSIVVVLVGIFLWLLDIFFGWLVRLLLAL